MKTIDHDDTDYNYVTCSQLLHVIKSRGELLILRPSIYVHMLHVYTTVIKTQVMSQKEIM